MLIVDRIDTLWAIEQIRQLKARFFRYTDIRDPDLLFTVFSDDVVLVWYAADNETVARTTHGLAEFRAMVTAMAPRAGGFSVHMAHTHEIELIDADHARGIWPVEEYILEPGAARFKGYGYYHDEYTRERTGEWTISRCELKRLRVDQLPAEQ